MKTGFSARRAWAVLRKEMIQLGRDKVSLRMIVLIPIIQLLLFGYALNNDPKNLPTAVLSQDNTPIVRAFVAGLENTRYFSVDYNISSEEEAHELLQEGKVLFVVNIPANFQRDLLRGQRPEILIEADATDPQASAGAIAAVGGMLDRVLREELKGPLAHLRGAPPAVTLVTQRNYNPEGFTRYNIVPGLIAVILTMTGLMMTALAVTRERERGTMENLLAMPVTPLEVMVGKIAPYIMIGFFQAAVIVVVAYTLFQVPVMGSLWLLSLTTLVFIACNMALGFTLSATADNQTQALQLSMIVTLPSILLSGFMFPFHGMPAWAQILGTIIPATHFIVICRSIMLKGATLTEIWPHFWPLLVFMAAITVIAVKRYRRTLD